MRIKSKNIETPEGTVTYDVYTCENCGKDFIDRPYLIGNAIQGDLKSKIFFSKSKDAREALDWLACSTSCARILFNLMIDKIAAYEKETGEAPKTAA